jgi:hypothetical protein
MEGDNVKELTLKGKMKNNVYQDAHGSPVDSVLT